MAEVLLAGEASLHCKVQSVGRRVQDIEGWAGPPLSRRPRAEPSGGRGRRVMSLASACENLKITMMAAVERTWNKQASQGHILALAPADFSTKVFEASDGVPFLLGSAGLSGGRGQRAKSLASACTLHEGEV